MENLVNQQLLRSAYKNKKVFVTGHTGFKGSWLLALLSQLGAEIKGYALPPAQNECLFNILQPVTLFENIFADVRDKEKLREEIFSFQPDFIFHLAAQALVRRSYKIPAETFEVNVLGTANVLEALIPLEKKCTVVIITTDKVYHNREDYTLYNEADSLGGYDPYSASKACAELVVDAFRNSFFNTAHVEKHEKGIVTVRAGNVIGGGDFSDDRIIPDIVKALKTERMIEVRNPNAVRPWQHVLEPLAGYLQLGMLMNDKPVKYSGAYNFGPLPTDHLTVKELVKLAIDTWGCGEWRDISDDKQPHEATLLKLDIAKAVKILGWQPMLNAMQAVEWTVNWYKNAASDPDFTLKQVNEYMHL